MSGSTQPLPSVTVLLVNHNGAHHLPPCLDSLAQLDYPRARVEVLVVDNASTDGSRELLRDDYPWVRLLALDENRGFAGGNNAGAAASGSDCIALLNTDMRVERSWLRRLVAAYDPAAGYACVAGVILDWDGERLDFAEGAVDYYGMGAQLGFGRALEDVEIPRDRDLLFACGGAMLIDRRVFLELGGFDETYFAYFEDVDLGWRLWLAGYRVRLADDARVLHRHHGATAGVPLHQRRVLYERNALRTLVKNLDDLNLWPLLAAALLLLAERARAEMGTQPEAYDLFSGSSDETESVRREGVAAVHAAADIAHELEGLLEARARVQALRTRTDDEIFELFRRPFLPLGGPSLASLEAMATVTHALRLDALFPRRRASRVLLVGGEAVRALARPVARRTSCTVAVASSTPVELEGAGLEVVRFANDAELDRLVLEADVLVADTEALARHPQLGHASAIRIIDQDADGGTPSSSAADVVLRGRDRVETIVRVCEQPWKWRMQRATTLTEDVQTLLVTARSELRAAEEARAHAQSTLRAAEQVRLEAERPLAFRAAGAAWSRTPELLRQRLRPALRWAQERAAQRDSENGTA